jgi:uncharacterized protein YndB with AHSA1/START domain
MERSPPMTQTTGRTDQQSLRVSAPAGRIYAALVDREAVEAWLPPEGARGEIAEFDPRVGGSFRMTLHFTGNAGGHGKTSKDSDEIDARFTALEPGRLVRQDIRFVSDDPDSAGTMTMSWQLKPDGEETDETVVAENVPKSISAADHEAGLRASLKNLAEFVQEQPASR